MKTVTVQPLPARFDVTYRFTVQDYYRLAEAGILPGDARVELLDGQLIPKAPIGPEHHWILDTLTETFIRQSHGRYRVGPGRSLLIPDHNVPEPDLVLYRPSVSRQRHVAANEALLVVEIADSTLERDLGFKADLYQEAQVPEYWVVDVRNDCVHLFTLTSARYEKKIFREGTVSPGALPDVEIDLAHLFGH